MQVVVVVLHKPGIVSKVRDRGGWSLVTLERDIREDGGQKEH